MTDLLGPASTANSLSSDPGETRTFGASDTFFKDATPGNQDGTYVPASWGNQINRLLRAAIRGMGITADNTNNNMLLQAIQAAQPAYGVDTSATPGAIVVNVNKPGFGVSAGAQVIVKLANLVPGATTIDVKNGAADLGTFNVLHSDLSALNFGDYGPGDMIELIFDGTQFIPLKAPGPSQVGKVDLFFTSGVMNRYVRANAETLGSASSGASERANADTQGLYNILWALNHADNSICPVVGGAGASAAADWAANKPITLPDLRGRGFIGADDMGNAAAGAFAGVPFTSGAATHIGSLLGENTHALVTGEMPVHSHTVTDPGHTHPIHYVQVSNQVGSAPGTLVEALGAGGSSAGNTDSAVTGIAGTNNTGSGSTHNNVARAAVVTIYLRLY
jgi:microcystin-dependent protein